MTLEFTEKTTESVVQPTVGVDDPVVEEFSLRPKSFDQYIGQNEVKENLQVFIKAAKDRGDVLEHTVLYGPPGLGKTTLAMILADCMGTNLKITSGPALEKPGDLASILSNLEPGDFLFIDEIHRLRLPIEEILYSAMEDFVMDIVIGKGPSARTMRMDLPKFTLVGATTKFSMLSNPLRDRFGHVEKLRFYEPAEMQQIIEQSADKLEVKIDSTAAEKLSHCCRRTPRIANRLLRRMRDFAQVLHEGDITMEVINEGLRRLKVDPQGLDYNDQQYLDILKHKFNGGPVGVSTLAAAMGEDEATVEEVIEPFLIREGMIEKTPRGRVLVQQNSLL